MKFVQRVRQERVLGPLRRGFDLAQWTAEHAKFGEDAGDRGLYDAGLLIHQKANEVRALVRFTYAAELTPTTKVRALVAMANHFGLETERRVKTRLAQLPGDGLPTQFDTLTMKLPLLVGADFSSDEIIQGTVDGCEIPIRDILEKSGSLDGAPKFTAVNWAHVWSDLNLGILYGHLKSLWNDCLWNGYLPHHGGETPAQIRFTAEDPEWSRRLTASELRFASLAAGSLMMIHTMHARNELPGLRLLAGLRQVKAIRKVGRKQVIVFAPEGAADANNDEAAMIRLYASELFYRDLLNEAQPNLGGATVDQLLSAWICLRQISELMRAPLRSIKEETRPVHAWLPDCAPLLQRSAIVAAFSKAVSLDTQAATAILEFLTYTGKRANELWAQPLVPASDAAVMPVFPALTAEPSRLLDVWLRQLGVDLALRGPAFEQHVRSELEQMISDSSLKALATVLPKPLVFTAAGGRREEIDVLLQIGDIVIIGEAKCALRPTESKQIARHRNVLIQGAAQVARKAAAVVAHPAAFRKLLLDHGMNVPASYRILPMVIVNNAIHAGFPIDGVPIVDLFILRVFFEGEFTDTVMDMTGPNRDVRRHRIYANAAEGPAKLEKYLLKPPQMATYVDGLRERWIPVGKLRATDTDWRYLGFQAIPDVRALQDAIAAT